MHVIANAMVQSTDLADSNSDCREKTDMQGE